MLFYDQKNIDFNDIYFFGELSLDGNIKDTSSIFPIILSLTKKNLINKVLVCQESAKKLLNIPNLEIYCVKNLDDAINFIKSNKKEDFLYKKNPLEYKILKINDTEYYFDTNYLEDFEDVIGQDMAKNATLISSAGNHNIILKEVLVVVIHDFKKIKIYYATYEFRRNSRESKTSIAGL